MTDTDEDESREDNPTALSHETEQAMEYMAQLYGFTLKPPTP